MSRGIVRVGVSKSSVRTGVDQWFGCHLSTLTLPVTQRHKNSILMTALPRVDDSCPTVELVVSVAILNLWDAGK